MKNLAQAEAYYSQGLDLLNTGDYENALRKFLDSVKLDPENGRYLSAAALGYFLISEFEESIRFYLQAIEKDPDNYNNYIYLSNVYQINEEFSKSTATLEKGLNLINSRIQENPDDAYLYGTRGMLFYLLKAFDQAIMSYYLALMKNEMIGDYYRELANIYYELNFYEETVRLADKAVALNPRDSSAFLHRALAYQRLNLISLAITDLKRSLQLSPGQKEVKELLNKLNDIKTENGDTIEELIHAAKPGKTYSGTVKWFDDSKGIGFLNARGRKKEVFVHFSAILSDGYQSLREGDQVTFGIIDSPRGLVAINVKAVETSQDRYLFGHVQDFDLDNGLGTVTDGEYDYPFHFTALVGRLIRVVVPGEKTRFEIITDSSSGDVNAFNVKILDETVTGYHGKIVWFDKNTGNGVIAADDGQECIFQRSSYHEDMHDKLFTDARVSFQIIEIENIDGTLIPKAVKIDIIKD